MLQVLRIATAKTYPSRIFWYSTLLVSERFIQKSIVKPTRKWDVNRAVGVNMPKFGLAVSEFPAS
jgi:hypothetical protein